MASPDPMIGILDYRSQAAVCVEVRRRKPETWKQPLDHCWKLYVPLSHADPDATHLKFFWLFMCWESSGVLRQEHRRRGTREAPALSLGARRLLDSMKAHQGLRGFQATEPARGWYTLQELLCIPDIQGCWQDNETASSWLSVLQTLGNPDNVRVVFWRI